MQSCSSSSGADAEESVGWREKGQSDVAGDPALAPEPLGGHSQAQAAVSGDPGPLTAQSQEGSGPRTEYNPYLT